MSLITNMRKSAKNHKLVLAIDPATRGFGFAIFEGPQKPIDWGVKDIRRNKNEMCLLKVKELIDFYRPDVIVLEDFTGKGSRRCKRIQKLIIDIRKLASSNKVKTECFSQAKVKLFFSRFDAHTKYEIVLKIAKWLPVFENRLPPIRKPWMSEDYRMAIFDAVSMALVFFYFEENTRV